MSTLTSLWFAPTLRDRCAGPKRVTFCLYVASKGYIISLNNNTVVDGAKTTHLPGLVFFVASHLHVIDF